MMGWHFVGGTLRDGSAIPADGVPLVYTKPLEICCTGLHFSLEPWHALEYAPGDTLCYVKVEQEAVAQRHSDKGVCAKRTIIKRHNVRELLYDFACAEAWAAVKEHNPPSIVKAYLLGTPAERDAARGAARGAAWGAARDAAWDAARARQRATFNARVFKLFNGRSI